MLKHLKTLIEGKRLINFFTLTEKTDNIKKLARQKSEELNGEYLIVNNKVVISYTLTTN